MIVQHTMFFREFLQQDCILETLNILKKAHRKGDCSRCFYLSTVRDQILQKLSSVAEGGFGSGEIASYLVGDTPARSKEQTALALTHVVKDAHILYNLLFESGAMDLLFDVLQVSVEALEGKNDFLINLAQDGENGLEREEEKEVIESKRECCSENIAHIEDRFEMAVRALIEIGKTCRMCMEDVRLPPAEEEVCNAEELLLEDDSPEGVSLELDNGKTLLVHRDNLVSLN